MTHVWDLAPHGGILLYLLKHRQSSKNFVWRGPSLMKDGPASASRIIVVSSAIGEARTTSNTARVDNEVDRS
jgi:hypothetical protein